MRDIDLESPKSKVLRIENLIFLLNDKNNEKSKTFSQSGTIGQLEQVFFFSHYCLNFIEIQLNICSLYKEYNFDTRTKGHS